MAAVAATQVPAVRLLLSPAHCVTLERLGYIFLRHGSMSNVGAVWDMQNCLKSRLGNLGYFVFCYNVAVLIFIFASILFTSTDTVVSCFVHKLLDLIRDIVLGMTSLLLIRGRLLFGESCFICRGLC